MKSGTTQLILDLPIDQAAGLPDPSSLLSGSFGNSASSGLLVADAAGSLAAG